MTINYDAGVFFNEVDQSTELLVPSGTAICFFGGATKGTPNELTLIANEADLIKKFQKPLTSDYGLQAAIQTIRRTGSLYYVRVTDGTEASATVTINENTETPGVAGATSQNVDAASPGDMGNDLSVEYQMDEGTTYSETLAVDALGVPPASPIAGNFANVYVVPGTLQVTLSFIDPAAPGVVVTDVINDDGLGVFSAGTYINVAVNSTVNYQDGAYSLTHGGLPIAVVSGSLSIVATYKKAQYDQTGFDMAIAAFLTQSQTYDLTTLKQDYYPNTWRVQLGSAFVVVVDTITGLVVANGVKFDDGLGDITFPIGVFDNGLGATIDITIDYDTGRVIFPGAAAAPRLTNQTGVAIRTYIGYRDPFYDVIVLAPVDLTGQVGEVEIFYDCVQDSGSPRYVETVVNNGVTGENSKSEYIVVDFLFAGMPEVGTFALTSGLDGMGALVDASYIGTYTAGSPTGLQVIADAERIEVDVVAVPGVTSAAVVQELFRVNEVARGDSHGLVDPPFGLAYDAVIDWHNGTGVYAAQAQFNSSFASIYYGWLKAYDAYNRQELWLPPSGFVAPVYAYTDKVGHPWEAPAGDNRGRILGATATEYNIDSSIRSLLVKFPNAINPIVDFINGGLEVWNSLTLARTNTKLREVSVRRMVNYVKRTLIKSCRSLVFELNNERLWGRFTNLANELLKDIEIAGGISRFIVVCDGTVNDSTKTTMKAKIIVVPVVPAKQIVIDFTLTQEGRGFAAES